MSKTESVHIVLTDARPMRVSKSAWPLVARATKDRDHNNQELFRRHYLRVRMHAVRVAAGSPRAMEYVGGGDDGAPALAPHPDGRVVVYGWYDTSYQGESDMKAGYVTTLEDAPRYIRTVGEAIGAPEHLIAECCGDLPAVDETEEVQDLAATLTTGQLQAEVARRAV